MLVERMAIAQRIAPHSNKISGPKSCPIRNSTRVSMRLPKATRMVFSKLRNTLRPIIGNGFQNVERLD